MTREALLDAIGLLPEDMLAEAAEKRMRRPGHRIPWVAAAACLCLLLTLPLAMGNGMKAHNKAEPESPMEMVQDQAGSLLDRFYAGSSAEDAGEIKVLTEHFLALVVEAGEGHLLVEPLKDEWEHSAADRILVPIPSPRDPQEFAPGDLVRITYNGNIRETFPPQAAGVTGIERLG